MTEDELKAIDQRLAAMSDRCDAVIEKEKPLGKPMPILDFKPRPLDYTTQVELLTGTCIDDIFADFERQFDEMAQAHRR